MTIMYTKRMKKLNIFLDLDNTLLLTLPLSSTPPPRRIHCVYYKSGWITYQMCARPYLTYFLRELNKIANISIWTAATKEYAKFAIQYFFPPEIKIHHFLSRNETIFYSKRTGRMKPIDQLYLMFPECTPDTTFIVDDLLYVQQSNPYNCIPILPLTTETLTPKDTRLIHTLNRIYDIIYSSR